MIIKQGNVVEGRKFKYSTFQGDFLRYVTLRENDGRLLRQCRVLDFATPAGNNCKNCTAALAANKDAFRYRRRETENLVLNI